MTIRRDESLPKLGWYAAIDRRADTCDVEVGRFVEVDPAPAPRWVMAGFWSGDFVAGNFHTAEHVFGSGLRLEDDEVVVVPAHSTVDRCLYVREGHTWHVSNSLVLLLGRLGARLDPDFDHLRWSQSTCLGVTNYQRQFGVLHPRAPVMSQLVFEALHLDEKGEASFRCHDTPHGFTGFHDYVTQLSAALRALWKNATDPRRHRPMRAAATVSRGYDSPTVLALAQPIVREPMIAWTTRAADDDGSELARQLGAEPRYLEPHEPHLPAELEAWCWASAQTPPELLFHSVLSEADSHDVPTVFFGGHLGDAVWEVELSELKLEGQLVRRTPSGVALGEARTRYGLVDCSPPYLFARSVAALHRVTTSDELSPWRLGNGYDRPICRRILEERGVSRAAFGWGKKAPTEDFESPRGEALRALFFERTGWSPVKEAIYREVKSGLRKSHRGLGRWVDLQRSTFVMTTSWLADRYSKR